MSEKDTVTYIDAWRDGHAEGMTLVFKLINEHCGTSFSKPADAIAHIQGVHDQVQSLGGELEGVSFPPEVEAPTAAELDAQSVQELEGIEYEPLLFYCVARNKDKFHFNFLNLNYRSGSVTLTPTLVEIKTSERIFPNHESSEIVVFKEKIFDVVHDGKHVNFTIEGSGEFILSFIDELTSKAVFDMLVGNISLKAQALESDFSELRDIIFSNQSTAWVSSLIVATCVAIFGLMCLNGYGIFSSDAFIAIQWGSKFPPLVYDGEYWRLLTAGFLHLGLIHLGLNMMILYQTGYYFERIYGSLHFLALYVFCVLLSSILSAWWSPGVNSLGASGAIIGLFSAVTTYALFSRNKLPSSISKLMIKDGLIFFALNLSLGFSLSFVDNGAHVGGIVSGVIFGFIFSRPLTAERSHVIDLDFISRVAVSCLIVLGAWYFLIAQNKDFQEKLEKPRASYYLSLGRSQYNKKEFDGALKSFHTASDLGDKFAPGFLGYMYDKGEGAAKNPTKSIYWNGVGMQRGDGSAAFNLGIAYEYGEGVEKDVNRAFQLYAKSAELDFIRGKFYMIESLLMGNNGIAQDEALALKYVQELGSNAFGIGVVQAAVKDKRPLGHFIIGKFYQLGFGFDIDHKLAFEHFSEAAKQNHALSEFEVGVALLQGSGVEADSAQAKKLFTRAVEHGFKPTTEMLKKYKKE